ncbi:MAG TPA: hypothetical protein VN963_09310, partial [bacterium]|nr:hypothetical protein [bacterium]
NDCFMRKPLLFLKLTFLFLFLAAPTVRSFAAYGDSEDPVRSLSDSSVSSPQKASGFAALRVSFQHPKCLLSLAKERPESADWFRVHYEIPVVSVVSSFRKNQFLPVNPLSFRSSVLRI